MKLLFFLLLTFALIGCNDEVDEPVDKICELRYSSYLDSIPSKIVINIVVGDLYEDNTNEKKVKLWLTTQHIYPCYNYILVACDSIDNGIHVRLYGILPPQNICLEAFGPAQRSFIYDYHIGQYNLSLSNGMASDIYSINISKDSITIPISDTSFSFIGYIIDNR